MNKQEIYRFQQIAGGGKKKLNSEIKRLPEIDHPKITSSSGGTRRKHFTLSRTRTTKSTPFIKSINLYVAKNGTEMGR